MAQMPLRISGCSLGYQGPFEETQQRSFDAASWIDGGCVTMLTRLLPPQRPSAHRLGGKAQLPAKPKSREKRGFVRRARALHREGSRDRRMPHLPERRRIPAWCSAKALI